MFKDIKVGDSLHLIDMDPQTGLPSYTEVSVEEVVPEYVPATASFGQNKVVDIVFNHRGDNKKLPGVDGTASSAVAGRYKIGCDKGWAMAEVRNTHDVCKNHVASMEKYKDIERACSDILASNGLSSLKDSERLDAVEKSVGRVESEVSEMKAMLSEFISNQKPKTDGKETVPRSSNGQGPRGAK